MSMNKVEDVIYQACRLYIARNGFHGNDIRKLIRTNLTYLVREMTYEDRAKLTKEIFQNILALDKDDSAIIQGQCKRNFQTETYKKLDDTEIITKLMR